MYQESIKEIISESVTELLIVMFCNFVYRGGNVGANEEGHGGTEEKPE